MVLLRKIWKETRAKHSMTASYESHILGTWKLKFDEIQNNFQIPRTAKNEARGQQSDGVEADWRNKVAQLKLS